MRGWIGQDALRRLRDQELYGLRSLLFRALTCPQIDPADLPSIRATLAAIEAELARRSRAPSPAL